MIHEVKILPEFFSAIARGEKTFEVRKKDRPYAVGDYLAMNEFVTNEQSERHVYTQGEYRLVDDGYYTGKCMIQKIIYILDDPRYCAEGTIILSLEKVQLHDSAQGAHSLFDID